MPSRLAWDSHGNLYVSEASRGLVVRLDRFGRVTVVAGGGPGTTNGGPALSAQLGFPTGVAVDRNDNVFVSLLSARDIFKIDSAGTISRILHPSEQFPLGDGGDAGAGNFKAPEAVAVDSRGNLYIADPTDHRLRKIDTNGVIATIAGTGAPGYWGDGDWATSAALNYPSGVAVDSLGNVFVSDTTNNRVRKITADAKISTVVGDGTPGFKGDGGPGLAARVVAPTALAIDELDNLLVVDAGNARIRRLSTAGTISTVAGGGTALNPPIATNIALKGPSGVAADGFGSFFIAEQDGRVVRRVRSDGKISLVAGNGKTNYSGDGARATNAGLSKPIGLAVDRFGRVYISDAGASRVRVVNTNGVIDTSITPETYLDFYGRTNYLINPRGLAIKPNGELVVADGLGRRIWGYRTAGDPHFTIPALTTRSAGDYDAIVSNATGSVTSSVAQVSIQLPPIMAQLVPDMGLRIATHGQPGVTYILEGSPELGATWLPVYTNDADRTGNWKFDASLAVAEWQRWFRMNVK
jgi:sugar lactone lactonase YvrE